MRLYPFYWGHIREISGKMEKKMETTVLVGDQTRPGGLERRARRHCQQKPQVPWIGIGAQ